MFGQFCNEKRKPYFWSPAAAGQVTLSQPFTLWLLDPPTSPFPTQTPLCTHQLSKFSILSAPTFPVWVQPYSHWVPSLSPPRSSLTPDSAGPASCPFPLATATQPQRVFAPEPPALGPVPGSREPRQRGSCGWSGLCSSGAGWGCRPGPPIPPAAAACCVPRCRGSLSWVAWPASVLPSETRPSSQSRRAGGTARWSAWWAGCRWTCCR